MSKTFHCQAFTTLVMVILCIQAQAQEFQWPRERAFELGAGTSGTGGLYLHGGYIHYFQPRKITEIPFKKRFKSLIARNKYRPFPCQRKPSYKIPPGLSTKVSLFTEMGSGRGVQYRIIGMDASVLYLIYSRSNLYISIKGGVTVSNNRLLTPLNEAGKSNYYDRYKYGVLGGLELERMMGRLQSTSFIAGWQECYLLQQGDSWGNERWYAFVGLRFKIARKW